MTSENQGSFYQNINFSGSQLYGGTQIGIGDNMNVDRQQLTKAEVVELIAQIKILVQESYLAENQKLKAIKYLEVAREEVQELNPDKEFASQNLLRAFYVIEEASKLQKSSQLLSEKFKPIFVSLASWLGIDAKQFSWI